MGNRKVGVDIRRVFEGVAQVVAAGLVAKAELHGRRRRVSIGGCLRANRCRAAGGHDDGEDEVVEEAHV